jgi:hypothetical protein
LAAVYITQAMKKLALFALVALAFPGIASAKGPSGASIVGPGISAIRIAGTEGGTTPYWRLVEAAGWFEATWGPSRLRQTPPPGDLGPRYTITWTVPSSSKLSQDVYPYAQPYPVTYMPRGQEIWSTAVKGGWFEGGQPLEKALLRVGLPAERPAAPASSSSQRQTVGVGGLAAAAALIAFATSLPPRSSGAAGT